MPTCLGSGMGRIWRGRSSRTAGIAALLGWTVVDDIRPLRAGALGISLILRGNPASGFEPFWPRRDEADSSCNLGLTRVARSDGSGRPRPAPGPAHAGLRSV